MPADRNGKPWTREETLAALVLYMHLPRGLFHARNPDVIALSEALGRTPASVARKLSNIEHFDPNRDPDVVGSAHGSHWERDIWAELSERGDGLLEEAIGHYRDAMEPAYDVEYTGSDLALEIVEGRDVGVTTTRRLNQSHFRNLLLELYHGRCCVTGLGIERLLIASHIKPWRDADPLTERVNVENGLLLNSLHDRAFDQGLITLDSDYRLVMSRELERRAASDGSDAVAWLWSTRGRSIRLPERHWPNPDFIAYHQDVVFLG
ncbi:MAG: HNH endonuclease [Atopobiaceae bacterium]|nr:HNH endonuclease [Atopobiaceae bacterium]